MSNLKIDVEQMGHFNEIIYGDRNAKVTYQTFDDCKSKPHTKRPHLATVVHGTVFELKNNLERLQNMGAGIFQMINQGDYQGRANKNVVSVNAYFCDEDKGRALTFPLKPSIVVQSKSGIQAYWKALPMQSLETFSLIQKSIAALLGTDPSVNDLCRVMRTPGTWHLKDPNDPFLVKIIEVNHA